MLSQEDEPSSQDSGMKEISTDHNVDPEGNEAKESLKHQSLKSGQLKNSRHPTSELTHRSNTEAASSLRKSVSMVSGAGDKKQASSSESTGTQLLSSREGSGTGTGSRSRDIVRVSRSSSFTSCTGSDLPVSRSMSESCDSGKSSGTGKHYFFFCRHNCHTGFDEVGSVKFGLHLNLEIILILDHSAA
jgi:hypothetical protein